MKSNVTSFDDVLIHHYLQVFVTQDGFFFETLLERILHSCPLDRKAASPKHACCTVITMAHDRTNKSLLFPPLGHCACRSYIPQSGRHMMRASAVLAWRKQAKLTKPRLCRLLLTWKLKFLMGMVHLLPRSYPLSANEKTSCRELWSTLCCFWLGSTSNPMNLNEHLSCKLVPSRFKLECSCLWWSSWGKEACSKVPWHGKWGSTLYTAKRQSLTSSAISNPPPLRV